MFSFCNFAAVDNDDGSAYYWIAGNVVYSGGFKNYLGHDKVNLLILSPNHIISPSPAALIFTSSPLLALKTGLGL